MQVYVKMGSGMGPWAIDRVELTTPVTRIKVLAAAAFRTATAKEVSAHQVRLRYGGKTLGFGDDGRATIGDFGLAAGETMAMEILNPRDYDPEVKKVLAQDLTSLASAKGTVVFIGIGSFDFDHGAASIRRQQCPPGLVELCTTNGLALRILLIDGAFEAEFSSDQIYDIDHDWALVPPASGTRQKYRRYTSSTGGDRQVWVYATSVHPDEYGLACLDPGRRLEGPRTRTLAGLDLVAIGNDVAKGGGALLAGNFYSAEVVPYFVCADHNLIGPLGPPYTLEW